MTHGVQGGGDCGVTCSVRHVQRLGQPLGVFGQLVGGVWPAGGALVHGLLVLDDIGGASSAVRAQCNYLGVWPY